MNDRQTPFIHPATPKKLIREFRKCKYKYHDLARARGVNVYHIYQLIHHGKLPSNPNIRKMLFIRPRRNRENGRPAPPAGVARAASLLTGGKPPVPPKRAQRPPAGTDGHHTEP